MDAPSSPIGPSTLSLLERARAGDEEALDVLFRRYLPLLQRWSRGRLPRWARDLRDTDDLVQDTLMQTLRHLDHFEARGEGALHAYLRQAVLNRVTDDVRRAARRPGPLDSAHASDAPSPLEEVIGQDLVDRYEGALQRLKPAERDAIVARIEFGASHAQLAAMLGRPSADAARVAVARALVRLATEMGIEDCGTPASRR